VTKDTRSKLTWHDRVLSDTHINKLSIKAYNGNQKRKSPFVKMIKEIRQINFHFEFFLICGNLRCFIAFSYKLLNVADDVIIMHSVEKGSYSSSRKVSHEWLATLRENNRTNNMNNTPRPKHNSSCYTRGPLELQAYESCYTTVEKTV